jgi:hypothetical protein
MTTRTGPISRSDRSSFSGRPRHGRRQPSVLPSDDHPPRMGRPARARAMVTCRLGPSTLTRASMRSVRQGCQGARPLRPNPRACPRQLAGALLAALACRPVRDEPGGSQQIACARQWPGMAPPDREIGPEAGSQGCRDASSYFHRALCSDHLAGLEYGQYMPYIDVGHDVQYCRKATIGYHVGPGDVRQADPVGHRMRLRHLRPPARPYGSGKSAMRSG